VPPSLEGFHDSLTTYHAAMAAVRRQGLTRQLPDDATAQIFGLAFALDQTSRNLEDLASRAAEQAGKREPKAAIT
jgi:2-keto-4-pentenoate hydratase/2-oxohepta-3-ene-1,7-dioic acid hydratase in catechol pathway